ncbi:MAG: GNAT family N-acetyltransferase [Candidatus Lokiarchaeota archaeon]|nr:GNAT family N-acetyltransferase [Candidatus Harpocratesius repetitus]
MGKKRKIFFGILVFTSIILQIIAVNLVIPRSSSHDLEFDYIYKWRLNGKTGDYYDYKEEMDVKGHYIVDFEGNIGIVKGEVQWIWKSIYQGYIDREDEGHTIYNFQFYLNNGSYIGFKTDQDEFHPNMNVWFFIPDISNQDTHKILYNSYEKSNSRVSNTIWIQSLSPQKGIKYSHTGTFHRNDVYGNMDAKFTSDYYFTKDGYLLGEIYKETDSGISNGWESTFEITSKVFVISSNYQRSLNWFSFLLAYWMPLLLIFGYFIVWKNYIEFRPKNIMIHRKKYILQYGIDFGLEKINFMTLYDDLLQTFIWRTFAQNGKVLSFSENDEILGMALIDTKDKIATLFGKGQKYMIQNADIKYFFSGNSRIRRYFRIEKYNILKIQDLQSKSFDYDAFLVKPLSEIYFPAVVDLITNEDFGKFNPNLLNWVHYAMYNEIAYVAIGKKSEKWIKDILNSLEEKNFPPPEAVGEDVIMGVGFAAHGTKTGWLYGLYVHPAFRNHGIGRTLALARLSTMKEIGIQDAITEIAQWNGPAKKIYEKFNAQAIGKIYLYGKTSTNVRIRRH